MTGKRKVSMPKGFMKRMDDTVSGKKEDRGNSFEEAVDSVPKDRHSAILREQMRLGYQEMATINLSLAEAHVIVEEEATLCVERKFLNVEWKI